MWRVAQWCTIAVGVVMWIVGLVLGVDGAPYLLYGTLPFLVGMVIFTARRSGGSFALGLTLFLVLLFGGIALAAMGGATAPVGGLMIPGSLFFLLAWFWWFAVGGRQWRNRRLRRSGLRSPAVIVATENAGITVEEDGTVLRRAVAIEVEVQRDDGPPFRARAEELLTEQQLAALAVGTRVFVRHRPGEPERVALDELVDA